MILTCNGAIKVVKWWCSSASVVPKYDGDDEVPYVMLYTSANKVPHTGAKSVILIVPVRCHMGCCMPVPSPWYTGTNEVPSMWYVGASEVPYGMLYAIAKPVV